MCWSTGREPMAQPPGSETVASPKRASSGPEHEDRRAHRLHQVVRRLGRGEPAGIEQHRRRRFAPMRSAATPMLRSSLSIVLTSCSCGTLAERAPARPSAARRTARAARRSWRPRSCTSPCSRRPPRIRSLSMMCDSWRCTARGPGHTPRAARDRPPAAHRRWGVSGGGPGAAAALEPEYSAGVSVFIDSAWICSRILSPSAA